MFADEASFYLLPGCVRTYAPRGQTPVLRSPLSRDHLSAVSGVTEEGQLCMQVRPRPLRGPDVVRFLRHLLRVFDERLLVVWDGAPIHRSKPVMEFLGTEEGRRLRLEALPAYAPELNPDEGVWNQLKRVELKNVCCRNLTHLRRELRKAKERLRRKPDVLKGCVRQPGLV